MNTRLSLKSELCLVVVLIEQRPLLKRGVAQFAGECLLIAVLGPERDLPDGNVRGVWMTGPDVILHTGQLPLPEVSKCKSYPYL